MRARLVADAGLGAILPPEELSPPRLRAALDDLLAAQRPEVDDSLHHGAARAAVLLSELALRPRPTKRLAAAAR